MQEKAGTDIARAANKLLRRESCWKDIAKKRSMAFQLRNARSFAGKTLKGQVDAVPNGLRRKFWRIRSFDHLGKEGEMLKEGIPRLALETGSNRIAPLFHSSYGSLT
jgi:hypothetical protein